MDKILIIILSLSICVACAPSEMNPEDMHAYIQDSDNGLLKSEEVNGIQAMLWYRPTDMLVHQEIGEEQVTQRAVDSLRNKYNKHHYFLLSLSKQNKEALHTAPGSMSEYSELVQTLSFRMNNYVNLTTNKQDTIPVGDFILDRTYGLSSATSLLFVFAADKTIKSDWIQFNLNEFGLGTGNQRFRFALDDIENTPTIKFNTLP
jgi:hypothetical protein